MNILLVGGTWSDNKDETKASSLVDGVYKTLMREHFVVMYNGGAYSQLSSIINSAEQYDVVFWWPNIVDNNLPKIRNVKEIAPKTLLVSSKRNDNEKYSFMELVQHALALKANLAFEFRKEEDIFHIRVFDPLGCSWYDGVSIVDAVNSAMNRLEFLTSVTRQGTIPSDIKKQDVFDLFFPEKMHHSDDIVSVPQEQMFIDIVKKHAERFHEILSPGKHTQRFLGNASMRPPQVGRCSKGMPSFKSGDYVFVSQRNIDKQFITLDNFVPCYMKNDKLYYCGDKKPSVDAPVQVRLYKALPHVKYILHSHCYLQNAHWTKKAIPCGALEEIDEILDVVAEIDKLFDEFLKTWLAAHGKSQTQEAKPLCYLINLKGHGSIVLASSISAFDDLQYIPRPLPEVL